MSAPYAPGTPQPPFAPQPRNPRDRSVPLATASMVLGILGLAIAFIPVLLHLGFILGILALVFGLVTLRHRLQKSLAGVILGGAAVVVSLLFGTIYGVASLGAASETAASSASATEAAEVAEVAPVEVPDVVGKTFDEATDLLKSAGFNVGGGGEAAETVASQAPDAGASVKPGTTVLLTPAADDGSSAANPAPAGTKFEMTSTNRLDGSSAEYTQWVDGYNDNFTSSNQFEQPDAGMKYVLLTVHVTATTAGVEAGSVAYDLALAGTDGSVYDSEFITGAKSMPSVTLGAGQSASGEVVFQVPNTFHGGTVSFGDGSVFVKTN